MSQGGPMGHADAPGTSGKGADRDLLSALSGTQANRVCEVADRTRRVVASSLGLMQEQKAGRKRMRSVALAVTLLVPLLLGPFIWWAVEQLSASGHMGEPRCQLALWVCVLCPALAAAVLMAGWTRR